MFFSDDVLPSSPPCLLPLLLPDSEPECNMYISAIIYTIIDYLPASSVEALPLVDAAAT